MTTVDDNRAMMTWGYGNEGNMDGPDDDGRQ
jgi:hypothetical protein